MNGGCGLKKLTCRNQGWPANVSGPAQSRFLLVSLLLAERRVPAGIAERFQVQQPVAVARGKFAARRILLQTQQHFLVTGTRIGRMETACIERTIGIADEPRHIARGTHGLGDRGEAPVERRTVAHRPVVHLIHAGEQRHAGRPTRQRLPEVPGKAHAIFREGIERRRADKRVPSRGQAIGTELVGRDQEDVDLGGAHEAVIAALCSVPRKSSAPLSSSVSA
jgi:hypothetical protein